MTILVVYFSWKGHTETVAKFLATQVGGELTRIEPAGRLNIAVGAMEAMLGIKSAILPCRTDLSGVDILVIATPVWAGKIPPFVSTYLSQVIHCGEKPFFVLAERGNPGTETPVDIVRRKLEDKGMYFVSSLVTLEKEVNSGEYQELVKTFSGKIRKP